MSVGIDERDRPFRLDRNQMIDSKFDELFDDVPLALPFRHRDRESQSAVVIPRLKSNRCHVDHDASTCNRPNGTESFVAVAIEDQHVFPHLRSQDLSSMSRLRFVEFDVTFD